MSAARFCAALAAILALAPAPAMAFDPNTFEALVLVEHDEEGFIVVGRKVMRRLGPGWHEKLPFIEQLAIITTTADRYVEVTASAPLAECDVTLSARYSVADARRAYDWRMANGLDSTQQLSIFKTPRDDYAEPRMRSAAALDGIAPDLTTRQVACGALDAWQRHDPARLIGTLNDDGTMIDRVDLYARCDAPARETCAVQPPVSRSSSSFARDSPRHR